MIWKILFWLIFIGLIAAYCLISEWRANDCVDTCENMAPEPSPGDTKDELLQKINEGTRIIYESVDWRKAFLVAIFSITFLILIALVLRWRMSWKHMYAPRGIMIAVALLSIFIGTYLAFLWMQNYFWKPMAIEIRDAAHLI